MSRATLDWFGDQLVAKVEADCRAAVNDTVDAARDDAKATHTWKPDPRTRTDLETQIVSEHCDPADANPTGSFGYTRRRGFYGLFHEESTVHEHMYPALRPAADRHFPTLLARLEERWT